MKIIVNSPHTSTCSAHGNITHTHKRDVTNPLIIGGGGLSMILKEAQSTIVDLISHDTYIVNSTALTVGGITITLICLALS